MALSFKNFESWYFSQNFQKEGQKYLDFFVCPFRRLYMTREYHISKLTFLKIFGFEKKFWRKFQNFWPIFENFASKIFVENSWFPPTVPRDSGREPWVFDNFQSSKIFRSKNLKSTKSVSETSPIHLDPHYKVVELAEICRLRYSKWGGRWESFWDMGRSLKNFGNRGYTPGLNSQKIFNKLSPFLTFQKFQKWNLKILGLKINLPKRGSFR